ncbi:hypothetical protein [Pedobacter aquatilis]|uniref:hypothetical protein n=1 Tax=Pedobacter aquatilis TaxID=351343 RepID=UPI00292E7E1E|nr:hypothetical protein [Pedobacter aquatilis]
MINNHKTSPKEPDTSTTDSANTSNLPQNQIPKFRSNLNAAQGQMKSEAGHLGTEVGEGDFGAEEARSDAEKGNSGSAGNMPYTVAQLKYNSRMNFGDLLAEKYTQIAEHTWKSGETLEISLSPSESIDDFISTIEREVKPQIGFQQHLDLLIKKLDGSYFKVIEINKRSSNRASQKI